MTWILSFHNYLLYASWSRITLVTEEFYDLFVQVARDVLQYRECVKSFAEKLKIAKIFMEAVHQS